jgi:hypothetical protein
MVPGALLTLDEGKQILVDLFLVGRTQAVWSALVNLERCVLDQIGRQQSRIGDRHDLVAKGQYFQRPDTQRKTSPATATWQTDGNER